MAWEGVVLAGAADGGSGRWLLKLELEQSLLLLLRGIDVRTCVVKAGRHDDQSLQTLYHDDAMGR